MSAPKRSGTGNIIGTRLQAAIDQWPEQLGVRTLAELLKQRSPRPRGSTPAMIHRYLRGAVTPPLEFIQAAADVLGADPSWLAGGSAAAAAEPWTTTVRDGDLNAVELRQFAVEGLTTRLPRFHLLSARTQRAALDAVEAWAQWSLGPNAEQYDGDADIQSQVTVEEWGAAALYVGMTLADSLAIPAQHLPDDAGRDEDFLADVAIALLRRIPTHGSAPGAVPLKKGGSAGKKKSIARKTTVGRNRRRGRGKA
jgi:hypothetical protein